MDYTAHVSEVQSNALDATFFNTRLDAHDCIVAFGSQYTTVYRDILIVTEDQSSASRTPAVTSNVSTPDSVLNAFVAPVPLLCPPPSWICKHRCGETWCALNAVANRPFHFDRESLDIPVQYCLAHKVQEECTVQLSRTIMLIVIVCNACKLFCFFVCLGMGGVHPLGMSSSARVS